MIMLNHLCFTFLILDPKALTNENIQHKIIYTSDDSYLPFKMINIHICLCNCPIKFVGLWIKGKKYKAKRNGPFTCKSYTTFQFLLWFYFLHYNAFTIIIIFLFRKRKLNSIGSRILL